jgi:hypothetical protein
MSTDATRCKVCGGQFSAKRIIIDGMAYHERCAVMSYPSHTHEDHQWLSERLSEALSALEDARSFMVEMRARHGDSGVGILIRAADKALAVTNGIRNVGD